MSVLLNALKKASEEKKLREAGSIKESALSFDSNVNREFEPKSESLQKSVDADFNMTILVDGLKSVDHEQSSSEPMMLESKLDSHKHPEILSSVEDKQSKQLSAFNLALEDFPNQAEDLQEDNAVVNLSKIDTPTLEDFKIVQSSELKDDVEQEAENSLAVQAKSVLASSEVSGASSIFNAEKSNPAELKAEDAGKFDLKLATLDDVDQSAYQNKLESIVDAVETSDAILNTDKIPSQAIIEPYSESESFVEPESVLAKVDNSSVDSTVEDDEANKEASLLSASDVDAKLQSFKENHDNSDMGFISQLFKNKKNSATDKLKAKKVRSLLFANQRTNEPVHSASQSIVKRMSFYLLIFIVVFLALAYYGLSSYQKLESEYDRDINYLLNIIGEAEREAAQEQAISHETVGLVLAESDHNNNQPEPNVTISNTESTPAASLITADEKQAVPDVKASDISPAVASKPSRPAQSPKPSIRIDVQTAKSYAEMGYEAYMKGDMLEARRHYQRHLQTFPRSNTARLGLAAVAAEQGESAVAFEYYQQVLSSDPNNVDAISGLAVLASDLNTQFFTLRELQQLVRRYPNSGALQFALGNYYAQQQDWFLAQPAYFEAVRLESQSADYRLNLAISLDQLGEYAEAIIHYKLSLALAGGVFSDSQQLTINQRVVDLQRFLEQR